jgi:hypothetical protein
VAGDEDDAVAGELVGHGHGLLGIAGVVADCPVIGPAVAITISALAAPAISVDAATARRVDLSCFIAFYCLVVVEMPRI